MIHHSDTDMTWLTLSRFHPINRITTALIDTFFLALLGFPTWALVANNLVRHYYGEFIHADLPWTYGRFGTLTGLAGNASVASRTGRGRRRE